MGKISEKILNFIKKNITQIYTVLVLFVSSLMLTFVVEFISRNDIASVFEFIFYWSFQYLLSTLVIFSTGLLITYITNIVEIGVIFNCIFYPVFSLINYYKLDYRSDPVFPWDIFVVSDAANILPEISLSLTLSTVIGIIIIALIIGFVFFMRFFFKIKTGFKRKRNRLIGAIVLVAVVMVGGYFSFFNTAFMSYNGISINQWDQAKGYRRAGLIPSFIMNFKYISVEKPEGYSKDSIQGIIDNTEKSDTQAQKTPNVIVIMSEAFTDLNRAENLSFERPLMPTVDYVRENYLSGYLLVSEFGGGTSNSEFEVLTGYSLAHLPAGCTPYQQFVLGKTDSIPSFLSSKGYNTVAIHTFGRRFWNRNDVYKRFGFDEFVASDNFFNAQRERGFISDYELTQRIIEEYENRAADNKPFFNFSVSVQNHTSYKPDEYSIYEQLTLSSDTATEDTLAKFTTLATGINHSDEALGILIDYFSNVDEPTVIIFFGDHIAKLGGGYNPYIEIGYYNPDDASAENLFKMFSTPFVAWNNFDDTRESNVRISAYQLLPYVFNKLDIVRPTYYNYLNEQAQYYKGFARNMYIDQNGNVTYNISEEAYEYFEKHALLEYDMFSGKKYANEYMWN